ncbi:MAG: dimethylsulfonioproprionate lyase family protein [Pseudomonadota bacterium]
MQNHVPSEFPAEDASSEPAELPQSAAPARRMSAEPDWRYVLREFYELYRNSGAGGSEAIRHHQRTVREALSRVIKANPPLLDRVPETKPVISHLMRALDLGRLEQRPAPLVRTLERLVPRLAWHYGYDKVPRGLVDRFAWAELAGPQGPVATDEVIIGLVLFAPGCTYPSHAHTGITESYYVLSGSVSQNDDGVFAPGSMLFNPPGRRHRITVGQRDPALLAYAWVGTKNELADQKLSFRKPKR